MNSNFNYIKPTGYFLIVGFLIPVFTAYVILGFQMLINSLGVECANSWLLVWILTMIGSIIAPIIFVRRVIKINNDDRKKRNGLRLFNIIEYTLLQSSITYFLTTGQTLCYVSDGQNGIELAFAAWISLPILFLISIVFTLIERRII